MVWGLKERLRRALLPISPLPEPRGPRAAVTALLVGDPLSVLLIKRRERPGDPWSGHVALPGGFVEPSDEGPLEAALRELREEVGVEVSVDDVVGMLSLANPLNRPEVEVVPFVAYVEDPPKLSLGGEVEAARWALLKHLEPRSVEVTWKGGAAVVEGFMVKDWVVWGLTARLLKELTSRLSGLI